MSRSRIALVVLFLAALLVPTSPAHASYTVLCTGYTSCTGKGYSHSSYESHKGTSYWNMYTGTNCTNYVAYRLVTTNGMPNKRPKAGVGNARDWGTAMASVTDTKPAVGAVAWWGRTGNHVAYVEQVVSSTEIVVSESNWSGTFDWRRITKTGSGWPDGFIHFADNKIVNTAKPAIIGTVKVGGALKASGGVWQPKGNDYAYQWLADGKTISGASSKTFTPDASHLDKKLTVSVTARRPSFPTLKVTSPAISVAPGTLSASTPPSITGTPQVDSPLTATSGTWSPTGSKLTYQWLAGGVTIAGATSPSFTPGPQQVGLPVSVRVRATKSGYSAVSSASSPTASIAPGPLSATRKPTIAGATQVGRRLTAAPGTWSRPGATYTYQWSVADLDVNRATEPTFVPRSVDLGKHVTVKVTAHLNGYATVTASSAPSAIVVPGTLTARSRPVVTGTPRVGARLTASTGVWSPTATHTFQWYADGQRITGATGQTYTLTRHQRDAKLRVRSTARRAGYTTLSSLSVNTPVITSGHISISKAPSITGSPRLKRVLKVDGGTHTPRGATLRYQWYRDGKKIPSATKRTHRVKTSDLGHRLSVRVRMSAAGYSVRHATTAQTSRAKATSSITTAATRPGKGRVTFSVRITAPGTSAPDGTVTIRRAGTKTTTVKIKNGRATLTLSGQSAGEHVYRFSYSGTSTVASATANRTLTVR